MDRVAELHKTIENAEQERARLLGRAESAGSFGDRRFRNLNAMLLRSKAARTGELQEAAETELESLGVEVVRQVQLPVAPMPQRRFTFRVIEGGPTGLMALGGGEIGCLHQIVGVDYDAAEMQAIEEHKERCQ